eukprot:jgi/Astpho2/2109/Aster-00588
MLSAGHIQTCSQANAWLVDHGHTECGASIALELIIEAGHEDTAKDIVSYMGRHSYLDQAGQLAAQVGIQAVQEGHGDKLALVLASWVAESDSALLVVVASAVRRQACSGHVKTAGGLAWNMIIHGREREVARLTAAMLQQGWRGAACHVSQSACLAGVQAQEIGLVASCTMVATGLQQHAAEVVAALVRNGLLTCVLVLAMEMLAQRKLHCQLQIMIALAHLPGMGVAGDRLPLAASKRHHRRHNHLRDFSEPSPCTRSDDARWLDHPVKRARVRSWVPAPGLQGNGQAGNAQEPQPPAARQEQPLVELQGTGRTQGTCTGSRRQRDRLVGCEAGAGQAHPAVTVSCAKKKHREAWEADHRLGGCLGPSSSGNALQSYGGVGTAACWGPSREAQQGSTACSACGGPCSAFARWHSLVMIALVPLAVSAAEADPLADLTLLLLRSGDPVVRSLLVLSVAALGATGHAGAVAELALVMLGRQEAASEYLAGLTAAMVREGRACEATKMCAAVVIRAAQKGRVHLILPLIHSLVEYHGQTALLAEACASLISGGHLAEACKVGGDKTAVSSHRLPILWASFSHYLVLQIAVAGVFIGQVISLAKVACQMIAERHVLEAIRLTSCVATRLADRAIERLFILYEECRRRVNTE